MQILANSPPFVAATPASWHDHLRHAIRDSATLLRALELPPTLASDEAQSDFATFVPLPYLSRIQKGDPADPLLLQVLASPNELDPVEGFVSDPVGDHSAQLQPGLLQKYHGRVLLIASGVCAVHCRYCFRRNYPYSQSPKSIKDWEPTFQQIGDDPSIHEVIFSGGDPWMIVDDLLEQMMDRIALIPHVTRIRFHTRLPIVIPQRVTSKLCRILEQSSRDVAIVLHSNHPRELDRDVEQACRELRATGATLLNQTVLLRGVNDQAAVLVELSERLFACGILPYYLHQLDRVRGSAAFEVPLDRARQIVTELRAQLPGYLVPRWVQEIPGQPSKTPLD